MPFFLAGLKEQEENYPPHTEQNTVRCNTRASSIKRIAVIGGYMLTWLKDILRDQYTEDIDKKVSQQIGKDFVSRKDFNNLNDEKKQLKKDVDERDKQLEGLKQVDAEGLKTKIEDLQKENKEAQEAHEAQVKQLKLNSAVEKALLSAKAKNTKAVKALLDLEKAELDGETVKGIDEQIKKLQEGDDSKFLFDNAKKNEHI